MVKLLFRIFVICQLLAFSTASDAADGVADSNRYWPQWRGPLGTGVAKDAKPPVEWSENKNIRWKTELPGNGHSTPIIWGDRIFLTAAIPYGDALRPRYSDAPGRHDNLPVTHHHKFVVLAVSRRDGNIIWQRTVHQGIPHEGGHYTASLASNSPVTDGELLFAFFGSHGLYCLNLDGELQWKKDFGKMQSKHGHGEGSSPALHGNTLVINWDHEGRSFVVALDKRNGNQRWKLMRKEVTSWATPIVIDCKGSPQVVISGTSRVRGYDLATGRIIWECGGLSANIVASPVAANGRVFVGSSYEKRALLAIRLEGARGDITGTDHVVWKRMRGTPYVPSPLLYGDSLYFLTHYQGVLTRVNAKTGENQPGPFRLSGIRNVYASPVGAADRVYITDRNGTTQVITNDDKPSILALNRLDDSFSASPAIAGQELYLRGQRNLYCITEN
jgi:outer membrane protein assembly factor BamB